MLYFFDDPPDGEAGESGHAGVAARERLGGVAERGEAARRRRLAVAAEPDTGDCADFEGLAASSMSSSASPTRALPPLRADLSP